MPNCCGSAGSCNCVITGGSGAAVSGVGTLANPYVVTAVEGYLDLGTASGSSITLDPNINWQVMDVAAPLVVNILDAPNGTSFVLSIRSGASNVTLNALLEDVMPTSIGRVLFMKERGQWYAAPHSPTDLTPPTAGTSVASLITLSTFRLTVTGASDALGLALQPYSFSLDDGANWSAWQTSNIYNPTGLAQGVAYPTRHRVRDSFGNITIGAQVLVTVLVDADLYDNFTGMTTNQNLTARALQTASPAQNWGGPAVGGTGVSSTSMKAFLVGGDTAVFTEGSNLVTPTATNWVATQKGYNVTIAGSQVRLCPKMDGTSAGYTGPVFVLKADGSITREGQGGNATVAVAGTVPTTGDFGVSVSGTTFKVLVNGVQVGSDVVVATATGTKMAFALFGSGTFSAAHVKYLP